jgi:AcrR family transcriptional regulator
MSVAIKISLNEGLFLKNPQDSELGRSIIKNSILLINEYGIETFTFKKLAFTINSTEASIYRYFINKHMLLLYLMNWYWEWVNYLINLNIINITDPKSKLQIVIHSFIAASSESPEVEYVNKKILQKIVISDGIKVYHTKEVDTENAKGFFKSYKNLAMTVSALISEVNPNFKYPFALATNLFEMTNNHIYLAQHLPRLTDINSQENDNNEVEKMLNYFVDKLLF